jgi:hypothetical protein
MEALGASGQGCCGQGALGHARRARGGGVKANTAGYRASWGCAAHRRASGLGRWHAGGVQVGQGQKRMRGLST